MDSKDIHGEGVSLKGITDISDNTRAISACVVYA